MIVDVSPQAKSVVEMGPQKVAEVFYKGPLFLLTKSSTNSTWPGEEEEKSSENLRKSGNNEQLVESGNNEELVVEPENKENPTNIKFVSQIEFVTNLEKNFATKIIGGLEAGLRVVVSHSFQWRIML